MGENANLGANTFGSALFYVAGALWTLALGAPYLALFAAPRRMRENCGMLYCRGLLVCLRLFVGLRHRVIGRDNLPPGACLIACKHQSAWETLALATVVERPSFVLKRELYRIPVFGWYLKAAGMVGINRRGGARALRAMIHDARRRAADGRPIVIFPEGTRVAVGAHGRIRPGVEALYAALDLPVVPIAVNSGLFWPRRAMAKRPGLITLSVLPPIAPGLDRAAFRDRLAAAINEESDRLAAAAGGGVVERSPGA